MNGYKDSIEIPAYLTDADDFYPVQNVNVVSTDSPGARVMKLYREESRQTMDKPQHGVDDENGAQGTSVFVKVKDTFYSAVDVLAAASRKSKSDQVDNKSEIVLSAVNFKPATKPSLQAIKSLEYRVNYGDKLQRTERKRQRRVKEAKRQEIFNAVKVRFVVNVFIVEEMSFLIWVFGAFHGSVRYSYSFFFDSNSACTAIVHTYVGIHIQRH